MRVAFDARNLHRPALRGMDRYLLGLTSALAELGVEPTLLHPADAPPRPEHLPGEVALRPVETPGGMRYDQRDLPRALARGGFDLYHAPAEQGVPLRAPCPVALTVHSATVASYRDLIARGLLLGPLEHYLGPGPHAPWSADRLYWRAQVQRADHVLTPSEYARQEVVRLLGVPGERVTATPLALPEPLRAPPAREAERAARLRARGVEAPYVLSVGGFGAHKNLGGLLAAFAQLRADRPDLSLVLVGTGAPPPALAASLARPALAGAVQVIRDAAGQELLDLYDHAALLLTLSWRETFCLPALEAAARGVPVVASAWGGAREVLGEHARWVDPRDPAAAADAARALLDAPPDADARAAAQAHARGFRWAETARATRAVYARLLAHGARHPTTRSTRT